MSTPADIARDMMLGAELCPHAELRANHSITVRGGRRAMTLCFAICYPMFQQLLEQWDRRQVGPADVVARLRRNGYTRGDAARFLLQLSARRLKARLGFAVDG